MDLLSKFFGNTVNYFKVGKASGSDGSESDLGTSEAARVLRLCPPCSRTVPSSFPRIAFSTARCV